MSLQATGLSGPQVVLVGGGIPGQEVSKQALAELEDDEVSELEDELQTGVKSFSQYWVVVATLWQAWQLAGVLVVQYVLTLPTQLKIVSFSGSESDPHEIGWSGPHVMLVGGGMPGQSS